MPRIFFRQVKRKVHGAAGGCYSTFERNVVHAENILKSDGTFEYLYATADADGKVTFGPVHELSPFMLVKGQLTASGSVSVPNTGGSSTLLPGALIFFAIACGTGAAVYRKKRTQA